MKKLLLVVTGCALVLASVVPLASAQDYELPTCSEDELAAVVEALDIYNEGVTSLEEISSDPNEAVYGAVVVGYDAFAYEFWNTVYPAFPACAEAQVLGLVVGLAYDNIAMAASFANIAGWAVAAEEADMADYFTSAASGRIAGVETMMNTIAETGVADLIAPLPACTVEEYTTNADALNTYFEGISAVFDELTMAAESDLEAGVIALVTVDTAANTYWNEVYPVLPACAEAEYEALLAGLILDESTLIRSLDVNAMLESATGDSDIADALLANTDARLADVMSVLDAMNMLDD